jgi:hypothetical protein
VFPLFFGKNLDGAFTIYAITYQSWVQEQISKNVTTVPAVDLAKAGQMAFIVR